MNTENVIIQHIEATPGIAGGKPRIAGSRITVQNVVIWYERMGMSADDIASAYGITLADVYAALAYYHDHRAAIDAAMRTDAEFVTELHGNTPSKIGIHGE